MWTRSTTGIGRESIRASCDAGVKDRPDWGAHALGHGTDDGSAAAMVCAELTVLVRNTHGQFGIEDEDSDQMLVGNYLRNSGETNWDISASAPSLAQSGHP